MTTLTINLTEDEEILFKNNNMNTAEKIKQFLIEKLEDMEDIKTADKAYRNYLNGSKTYSHEELLKELGLDD